MCVAAGLVVSVDVQQLLSVVQHSMGTMHPKRPPTHQHSTTELKGKPLSAVTSQQIKSGRARGLVAPCTPPQLAPPKDSKHGEWGGICVNEPAAMEQCGGRGGL